MNDNVIKNNAVEQVIKSQNGSLEIINTEGISMLSGYAYSEISNWGIISQTPKQSINEPTITLTKEVGKFTLPLMIFVFIISLLLLRLVVNPLRRLANFAHQISENELVHRPKISEGYYELKELKNAMFLMDDFYKKQLHSIESEVILDPLTGLYNRRSLNKMINNYKNYSLILFDADHFKLINDEFGHLMGDEVLKFIANLAKEEIREGDLPFRFGGEEFLILLPETDINDTFIIAEKVRKTVGTTISPVGKNITISIGIGNMPTTATHYTELFNLIDQALYKAKRDGRNRTVIAEEIKSDY